MSRRWRFAYYLANAKEDQMNPRSLIACILITLGIVVLAYSGLSFKTPGKPVDVGPIHVETSHSHFIPPIGGALALVGGIVLLALGNRQEGNS